MLCSRGRLWGTRRLCNPELKFAHWGVFLLRQNARELDLFVRAEPAFATSRKGLDAKGLGARCILRVGLCSLLGTQELEQSKHQKLSPWRVFTRKVISIIAKPNLPNGECSPRSKNAGFRQCPWRAGVGVLSMLLSGSHSGSKFKWDLQLQICICRFRVIFWGRAPTTLRAVKVRAATTGLDQGHVHQGRWRGRVLRWANCAVASSLGPAVLQRLGDGGSGSRTRHLPNHRTWFSQGDYSLWCLCRVGSGVTWYYVRCSWLLRSGTWSGSQSKLGWPWAICYFCFWVILRVCATLPLYCTLICPQPVWYIII